MRIRLALISRILCIVFFFFFFLPTYTASGCYVNLPNFLLPLPTRTSLSNLIPTVAAADLAILYRIRRSRVRGNCRRPVLVETALIFFWFRGIYTKVTYLSSLKLLLDYGDKNINTLKSWFSVTWFNVSVDRILRRGVWRVRGRRWSRARKSSSSVTTERAVPTISVLSFAVAMSTAHCICTLVRGGNVQCPLYVYFSSVAVLPWSQMFLIGELKG